MIKASISLMIWDRTWIIWWKYWKNWNATITFHYFKNWRKKHLKKYQFGRVRAEELQVREWAWEILLVHTNLVRRISGNKQQINEMYCIYILNI